MIGAIRRSLYAALIWLTFVPVSFGLTSDCAIGDPNSVQPTAPNPTAFHRATWTLGEATAFGAFNSGTTITGPRGTIPQIFSTAIPFPPRSGGATLHLLGPIPVAGVYTVEGSALLSGASILSDRQENCFPATGFLTACSTGGNAVVLGVDDKNSLIRSRTCPSVLERPGMTDTGIQIVYEDWSVFSGNGRSASAVNTVSDRHAQTVAGCYRDVDDDMFIVVNRYEHPQHHHRFTPEPEVAFSSIALRSTGRSAGVGELAVRIEVGERSGSKTVQILYNSAGVSQAVIDQLTQTMNVTFEDERRHQFSVYAIFDVTRSGLKLTDQLITLPKCCTGCPPAPNMCE